MGITELLRKAHSGDRQAMDEVVPLVYAELKKLAAGHLRKEHAVTLETTALVHEAYIRLAGSAQPNYENRAHFFGIASRLMRQILVDAARARHAQRRDVRLEVPIAEISETGAQPGEPVLLVDEALRRLAESDPRRAQMIEMRFFGGMKAEETAEALGLPVQEVRRELRLAQAWLAKEMAGA